jgi:hypothetical protein
MILLINENYPHFKDVDVVSNIGADWPPVRRQQLGTHQLIRPEKKFDQKSSTLQIFTILISKFMTSDRFMLLLNSVTCSHSIVICQKLATTYAIISTI